MAVVGLSVYLPLSQTFCSFFYGWTCQWLTRFEFIPPTSDEGRRKSIWTWKVAKERRIERPRGGRRRADFALPLLLPFADVIVLILLSFSLFVFSSVWQRPLLHFPFLLHLHRLFCNLLITLFISTREIISLSTQLTSNLQLWSIPG